MLITAAVGAVVFPMLLAFVTVKLTERNKGEVSPPPAEYTLNKLSEGL